MLKLPRRDRDGGGSFSPRKEGPLIVGDSSRSTGRSADFGGGKGAGSNEGREGGGAGEDALVENSAFCATGSGGASKVPPHMPQKRFVAGFSFPQRGQRTVLLTLIAYDILGVGCSAVRWREHQSLKCVSGLRLFCGFLGALSVKLVTAEIAEESREP